MDPIIQFRDWYECEKVASKSALPSACCLSSIGLDGYPNARYVSLKELRNGSFIVTGSMASRKGKEVAKNAKVALTFWWPTTERQVRIQGDASIIDASQANQYFQDRLMEAQIVSQISEQGEELTDRMAFEKLFAEKRNEGKKALERPEHWLGFSILSLSN